MNKKDKLAFVGIASFVVSFLWITIPLLGLIHTYLVVWVGFPLGITIIFVSATVSYNIADKIVSKVKDTIKEDNDDDR